MKHFKAPKESFEHLDAEAVAALVASAGDVALVMDAKGVIQDLTLGNADLPRDWHDQWVGRSWLDTVTVESRIKVESMLRDAEAGSPPRWRHVNHPMPRGADIPIQYSVVKLGAEGKMVAIGRDLRPSAALQQRLVEAQQTMERDYARQRHVEMRYRLLFQMTHEAILIADASTHKILEANPAAEALLGQAVGEATGRPLPDALDPADMPALQLLLAGVRATGRADEAEARTNSGRELRVSAALFRQDTASLFLIRLIPLAVERGEETRSEPQHFQIVEGMPDGFVVTDAEGRIIDANAAFLDLAQLAAEEQARGQSLERWLGRPGVDLGVLMANLRQHGSVRLYATTLHGEYGASAEIEVAAGAVPSAGQPRFGFSIRDVGRRLATETRKKELPRAVEQLTELVGRVPLKDLVRETTDVIERLCIEAALELTGDNRASAAEILGLSRQSLYVKLRRYGLGDLEAGE
ncbi:transcriptional regulator PpsR [Skermanella stibiiresistens]|uniref:transcriptional regulator PpsR n=1 Tax=Skermanella stibiiresistens TaxID=913326 RepID=UPI0004ADD445|nr:transcriptional regulator PpsR [Skermanella stibiiresistens]